MATKPKAIYTPQGWTRPMSTREEGAHVVMLGGRMYTYAQAASMKGRERECLVTLDRLWKKISPSQNLQIARELGHEEGFIGKDDGFRWIVRTGNLERAQAWVNKWFASRRSL